MLFNSPVYGVFLLVTYLVYWALRRHRLPRTIFLALASYVFYVVGTYDAATAGRAWPDHRSMVRT